MCTKADRKYRLHKKKKPDYRFTIVLSPAGEFEYIDIIITSFMVPTALQSGVCCFTTLVITSAVYEMPFSPVVVTVSIIIRLKKKEIRLLLRENRRKKKKTSAVS